MEVAIVAFNTCFCGARVSVGLVDRWWWRLRSAAGTGTATGPTAAGDGSGGAGGVGGAGRLLCHRMDPGSRLVIVTERESEMGWKFIQRTGVRFSAACVLRQHSVGSLHECVK